MRIALTLTLAVFVCACGLSTYDSGPTPPDEQEVDTSGLTIGGAQASNDSDQVTFTMRYSSSGSIYRVYLDTDVNPATGYAAGGLGADFLIENGRLYSHGGGGWNWSRAGTATFNATSGVATWQVARAAIRQTALCGDKITAAFNVDATSLLKLDYTYSCPAPAAALSASNDATQLTVQAPYSTAGTHYHVYFDTDRQASTGFSVGGLGADFMVENGRVFSHAGGGWSWTDLGAVTFSASSGVARWQLPRASIRQTVACGDRVLLGFAVDSGAVTKLDYTYACVGGGTGGGSGAGGGGGTNGTAGGTAAASTRTVSFTASDTVLLNPERGFYTGIDLTSSSSFSSVRSSGYTLALAQVRLDAYRTSALPASLVATLDSGLGRVRAAGIKVILRFKYNDGPDADASLSQIQAHITQLKPLFQSNADVIAVVQAGFIGAWGEWHSSTNGLDNSASRNAVLTALLAAVPASRMVQVRTPQFIGAAFPGGALDASRAFDGSNQARVGHHNDCFLASATDYGTYEDPVATWKAYVAQIGQFTPIGGETCNPFPPRSECANATAEMAQLHYSYMNSGYHQTVLAGWTTGGCMTDVKNQLGYRLRAVSLTYSDAVKPGGVLALRLSLANDGYAAMYNARPVRVVLSNGSTRYVATLDRQDARRWAGKATATVDTQLRVPSAVAAGSYTLSLWLPDASASLQGRPEYAVQLANQGLAIDSTGATGLATVTVDPSTAGPSVSNAAAFTEL